ncbi:MAG TPA: hypothetical protein VNA32_05680 [Actinomycetota bacterium]|nr:hypothetical protein [Actinomycetota bacterium]
MSTAEEAAEAWAIAWELDKAAWRTARKLHHGAQVLGMKFQNWKHRGAGEDAATPAPVAATPSGKSGGKKWSTEETLESTTYYQHTSWKKKTA